MLKRHGDTIKNRLEEVNFTGRAYILWHELYCWYSAQRITKSIYQDLEDRYKELFEDEPGLSMDIDVPGGILLVRTGHVKTIQAHVNGSDE